jgi:hypothetical protein
MKRSGLFGRASVALAASLGLVAMACDGGGGDDPAFDPEGGDQVAAAALPDAQDMPGEGWEVTDESSGPEEEDAGPSFEEIAGDEPECDHITQLGALGALFSDAGDDEATVGVASRDLAQSNSDLVIPTSVSFEVEILETVGDAQDGWDVAKEIFEDDRTGTCFEAIFPELIANEEDAPEGIKYTLTAREPSTEAPNNGAGMAFDLALEYRGAEFTAALELYLWPYSNAGVTITFIGTPDNIDAELIDAVLEAADERVKASAEE